MLIDFKYMLGLALALIGLIAMNVYQWQNPSVVEVPSGTEQIDSTAWVQRAAFTERGVIIDSLEAQSKALTEKLKESKDEIAQYTQINGRLKLQLDSLENGQWNELPRMMAAEDSASYLERAQREYREIQSLFDSTFVSRRQFGGGLFLVTGMVEFNGNQFRQHLAVEQLRDIRIDVATTISDDRRRVLTFVTSKDFESLEYASYTELEPKKTMPKFWIGVGLGVLGTALILK